jgi:ketosteroid isomerase-like protein
VRGNVRQLGYAALLAASIFSPHNTTHKEQNAMKIAPLIVALVMAMAPAASAQAPDTKPKQPTPKPADGSVEQTLMKIEQDALAALLKRDIAGFARVFADDAVLISPDGSPQTKSQLVADLKSGDLVVESSEISDMKVRAYGDSAVVTYVTSDKGKYKGQDISGRFRWTDVFVRRGGTWQIVAGQGTPIQAPPK